MLHKLQLKIILNFLIMCTHACLHVSSLQILSKNANSASTWPIIDHYKYCCQEQNIFNPIVVITANESAA